MGKRWLAPCFSSVSGGSPRSGGSDRLGSSFETLGASFFRVSAGGDIFDLYSDSFVGFYDSDVYLVVLRCRNVLQRYRLRRLFLDPSFGLSLLFLVATSGLASVRI